MDQQQKAVFYYRLLYQNRDMLIQVNQRKNALVMQYQLLSNICPLPMKQNKQLLDQLLLQHEQNIYKQSQYLLNHQVKAQRQAQLRYIVGLYEERIQELRNNYSQKQIDIAIETRSKKLSTIPTEDRMRSFLLTYIEHQNMIKLLNEQKDLSQSVKELEDQLRSLKQVASTDNSQQEDKRKVISHSATFQFSRKDIIKDSLLLKTYKLLQTQIVDENRLRRQLKKLQKEWKQLNNCHQKLVQSYKNKFYERELVTSQNS